MKMIILIFMVSVNLQLDWLLFNDTVNKINVKYPKSWIVKSNPNSLIILSPKENENDLFQENVNILIQDLKANPLDLQEYTNLTRSQVISQFGESSIISLRNVDINGYKAKEFIYNIVYQGMALKIKQYWFIKDKRAYVLSYTGEPINFPTYEKYASKIIFSLKLN